VAMPRCFVLLFCAVELVTAWPVAADDAGRDAPPPLAASQEAALLEAVRAYEAGDMERARVLFEQVHALAPTARTLRSLALVAFRQQRFDDAVMLFEACLASEVKPLTQQMRGDVSELLTEARLSRARQGEPAAPIVELEVA
jgi:predicted negative regulator of RcsB-dependent stress response